MKKLRMVAIGGWGHIREALEEILPLQEFELVALGGTGPDESPEWLCKEAKIGPRKVYPDYRTMLAETHPDLAVISTRLDRMAQAIIDASSAGCHTICEKPLAITHESLRKVWDAAVQHQVQCTTMMGNHLTPALVAIHSLVQSGKLGDIVLINARKSYRWGTRPAWFGQRSAYGGTIPWIGIHALDYIYAITGARFLSVAAMQSNRAHPDFPDCEDNCSLILHLSNQAHASISIDYCRPAGAESHGDDWIRVVGSRGMAETHTAMQGLRVATEDSGTTEIPLTTGEKFVPGLAQSLAHQGPDTPGSEMKRAFMLTDVSLYARDAADTKQMITVPSNPWM